MTQETFDYLLIRSALVNSPGKEIAASIDTRDNFLYLVSSIALLMEREDFILTSSDFQTSVEDIIQAHRFTYHDKEINEKVNYIIDKLNSYKKMEIKRKNYLIKKWIYQEMKDRNLPLCYQIPENLFTLISQDLSYALMFFEGHTEIHIDNPMEYVSLVNLIINRFPECFSDKVFLKITKDLCSFYKDLNVVYPVKHSYQKTLKKLNKNFEKVDDVDVRIEFKKNTN